MRDRLALLVLIPCFACGEPDTPVVYVVNYPLRYFAERVTEGAAEVVFPAPGDVDPAFWTPDQGTVEAYRKADRILLNGAGYAKWAGNASLPESKAVVTYTGRLIDVDGGVTHAHGPDAGHEHGEAAFTTWLDPAIAIEQARAIAKVLPGDGLAGLEADLRALDEEIEAVVSKNRKRPVLFSHPVYQYFERRYRLNGRSVHWEPDAVPDESAWAGLEKLRANHEAEWMVWEGEPLEETVKRLEALGVKSVVFDPCGNVPEEGDYLSVMRENVRNLARVYGP